MKTLQTIQKTFHVFQILTRIAFIFSIVGAVFCVVGALCCTVWQTGEQVFSLFGQPIVDFSGSTDMREVMAEMLSDLVFLTTDAVLLAFAGQYFKTEQEAGTPFTAHGADLLRNLGIRCIWMPIVSIVIASVITVTLGAENGDIGNLPGVVTGIVLILASLIFRYGAELEEQNRALVSGSEN